MAGLVRTLALSDAILTALFPAIALKLKPMLSDSAVTFPDWCRKALDECARPDYLDVWFGSESDRIKVVCRSILKLTSDLTEIPAALSKGSGLPVADF